MIHGVGRVSGRRAFLNASAIYIGTAVGAGIFGIPYAMAKFGFFPSVVFLALLTAATIFVSLFYGEVVLRTGGSCQMAGYAGKYLGKWGKKTIFLILISGNYGAILAYTIAVGQFLFEIFGSRFGGSPSLYGLAFFCLMSILIFRGLKMVAGAELAVSALFIAAIAVFMALGGPFIKWGNFLSFNPENFFLPYGVILFAIGAVTVIPLMEKTLECGHRLADLKKSIIAGALFTFLVYLAFAFLVVGVTGSDTSPEGIVGLGRALGGAGMIIGAIFGILTMSTSFLTLSLVLEDMYEFDYRVPHSLSVLLTLVVPLAVLLLGLQEFIKIIGIIGAVIGGLRSIMIIMMWIRAKKEGDREPEYSLKAPGVLVGILSLVFIAGVLYQMMQIFGT